MFYGSFWFDANLIQLMIITIILNPIRIWLERCAVRCCQYHIECFKCIFVSRQRHSEDASRFKFPESIGFHVAGIGKPTFHYPLKHSSRAPTCSTVFCFFFFSISNYYYWLFNFKNSESIYNSLKKKMNNRYQLISIINELLWLLLWCYYDCGRLLMNCYLKW